MQFKATPHRSMGDMKDKKIDNKTSKKF